MAVIFYEYEYLLAYQLLLCSTTHEDKRCLYDGCKEGSSISIAMAMMSRREAAEGNIYHYHRQYLIQHNRGQSVADDYDSIAR